MKCIQVYLVTLKNGENPIITYTYFYILLHKKTFTDITNITFFIRFDAFHIFPL